MRILKTLTPVIKPLMLKYLSKKRKYKCKGIKVVVYPGVFHPGFFFSTKFLLQFLSTLNLKKAKVLELGAGSGLISLYCNLRKEAVVTASDISSVSVINIQENAAINNAQINIVQSDLFDNINCDFDTIIINPPFYPKDPVSESENAWYCGKDFEFFKKLFYQLNSKAIPSTTIYMIVSEDCQTDRIESIANQNCFKMKVILEKKIWGERNFIYKIVKSHSGDVAGS